MKVIYDLSIYIGNITNISSKYIYLFLLTMILFIAIRLIRFIAMKIVLRLTTSNKEHYRYTNHITIFSNIILIIGIFIIWESTMKSLVTILSFTSAAMTIALREIIFNFFAGIYIKMKKPFKVEDRIELNGYEGDIININGLSFEMLEVGNNLYGEQSTGKIIHLPNSLIFTYPLKNYVKAFKYVWNEINIKVPMNTDLKKTKNILYKIINENEIIKRIPKKMKNQIDHVSTDYRIYFNQLKPIIYTKIVEDHVELYIRYLVHPKKARNVENDIWNSILTSYQEKQLELYIKE